MDNITLCGFMGSGKTTVGRLLASDMGYKFIDTDAAVESKYSMTISAIFEEYGEERFRDMESEIIKEICENRGQVISVGGGAVLREENAYTLRSCGEVIFLDVDAPTVIKRIGKGSTRPLLSGEDREEKVRSLMKERRPLYLRAATLTVDGRGCAKNVVKKITDLLKI